MKRLFSFLTKSEPERIAEWVAAEFKKRRQEGSVADEAQIAQEMLMARYANASSEIKDLAASNKPYVTSLATLCFTVLNMEAKGGRNTATLNRLYQGCLRHLQSTGVIETGGETTRLKQVEEAIDEAIEASGLSLEMRENAKVALKQLLITNQAHKQYQTEVELLAFIQEAINSAKRKDV